MHYHFFFAKIFQIKIQLTMPIITARQPVLIVIKTIGKAQKRSIHLRLIIRHHLLLKLNPQYMNLLNQPKGI